MLGAREMKGENGSSALTVRLSAFLFLVFLQIATLYVLDQQQILLVSLLVCLKLFSDSFSVTSPLIFGLLLHTCVSCPDVAPLFSF